MKSRRVSRYGWIDFNVFIVCLLVYRDGAVAVSARRLRQTQLSAARRQWVVLAIPCEDARHSVWQSDGRAGLTLGAVDRYGYVALWRWHSGLNGLQRSKSRLHMHRAETRRGRRYSCHDRQQVIVGVGTPGMRIGPCRFGLFCPGGQTVRDHGPPGAERLEVAIA